MKVTKDKCEAYLITQSLFAYLKYPQLNEKKKWIAGNVGNETLFFGSSLNRVTKNFQTMRKQKNSNILGNAINSYFFFWLQFFLSKFEMQKKFKNKFGSTFF